MIEWQRWAVVKETARADTTLCDYDGPMPRDICERVWRLAGILEARPRWIRQDRSKRGWHLIVRWNRQFTPAELTAMQAILGSDPAREALNLRRTLAGVDTPEQKKFWNILYQNKL